MVAFVRIISGNFNLKKLEEKRKEYFYNLFSKKGNNRKSRYADYRYRTFNQTT